MIIFQQNSFVFKPKTFWILHLNDHLYSKPCVFLWVANFRGLTASFARLPTLSRAFTVGHICITKNTGSFTRGVIFPCLLLPDTYFHFHVCNRATLLYVVPQYRVHHQTPNAMLIHIMHSHPFHVMSPCICNAMCYFMPILCHIYDECYMDNSTTNYINQHKISKRSHISCQYICTHIYQHQ